MSGEYRRAGHQEIMHRRLDEAQELLGDVILFNYFFLFCLKSRMRIKQRFFICWFIPQKPTTAAARPGRSQEPETQAASPMLVAGTQVLELSPAISQGVH